MKKKGSEPTDELPEVFAIESRGNGLSLSRRTLVALPALVGIGVAMRAEARDKADKHKESVKPTSNRLRAEDCGDHHAAATPIRVLALSADGRLLASAGTGAISLWSLPDGVLLKELKGHGNYVRSLASSADGKLLVSGSSDKTVKLWSLPEGQLSKSFDAQGPVRSVALSADGTQLAASLDHEFEYGNSKILLWALPAGTLTTTIEGARVRYPATSLVMSADGKMLVTGGSDGTIKSLPLPQGKPAKTLVDCGGAIDPMVTSRDEKLLVYCSADGNARADGTIRVISLPDGKAVRSFGDARDLVMCMAISADGELLVTGNVNKSIKLWSLRDGKLQQTLVWHRDRISALALSADGKLLVSASEDLNMRLWQLPQGTSTDCLYDPDSTGGAVPIAVCREKGEGSTCTCDTVMVPPGKPIPAGLLCVCNTVTVNQSSDAKGLQRKMRGNLCSCNTVCTCDSVCRCQTVGGGGGGHYWRPN